MVFFSLKSGIGGSVQHPRQRRCDQAQGHDQRHMRAVSPHYHEPLAAALGMLPLAMGRRIGAEMRNATGIASAGGILVSGVLTLIVIPTLYDLFTRRQSLINNKRHSSSPGP